MGVNGLVKRVLQEIGVHPDRFNLQWASAAEAPRFVKLITEFTKRIKELGPLGEAEGLSANEMQERLKKGLDLVSDKKLRMSFGALTRTLRKEGGKLTNEAVAVAIEEKLSKNIATFKTGIA